MITNKDLSIDSKNGKVTLNGNKYDLGTQGEIDAAVKDVYSVMGEMGAKNLLVPKWTETQTTENGVTYTFNVDGTIIMNTDASGATANTNCNLRQNTISTNNVFPAGSYTFTGCPVGGSSTKYRTWLRAYRPNTNTALTDNLYEEGNGVSFTVSEPFSLAINATVRSGYVCNNLTWKPMLRYASDTDNTYKPYAKTNKELTEAIGDLFDEDVDTHTMALNDTYTIPENVFNHKILLFHINRGGSAAGGFVIRPVINTGGAVYVGFVYGDANHYAKLGITASGVVTLSAFKWDDSNNIELKFMGLF